MSEDFNASADAILRRIVASEPRVPGVVPSLSNDEEAPTGRPAGALGWAGRANLFYWIDRRNGFGGFWATQILPFADAASFVGYMDFESAFYRSLRQRQAA